MSDQENKQYVVRDHLLVDQRNVPVDNVGIVPGFNFLPSGGSVDNVSNVADIPPQTSAYGVGWPMFRDGSSHPPRPAADEPLLLLPQLFSSLPNVSALPMFVSMDVAEADVEEEVNEMPIVRCPEADHKVGDFGGPGDDGYMLNNFGSRTLMLSKSDFRMYDLPKFYRIGDEKFSKLYSHYPAMFLGVYWDVGTEKVRLPASVVEAGIAYAIRLKHDREGFALVEVHVRELLFNVRLSADEYKFICQFAPFVIWNAVDCDQSHSLQRFIDGEYWNRKRVIQTYGLVACVATMLAAVVGGGIYYGRKKL
jgi:hypothetical protein